MKINIIYRYLFKLFEYISVEQDINKLIMLSSTFNVVKLGFGFEEMRVEILLVKKYLFGYVTDYAELRRI